MSRCSTKQFLKCIALRGATRDRRDFRPITAFFRFVNYDFEFHDSNYTSAQDDEARSSGPDFIAINISPPGLRFPTTLSLFDLLARSDWHSTSRGENLAYG